MFPMEVIALTQDQDNIRQMSLRELREILISPKGPVPDGFLEALEKDHRSGVRRLASAIRSALSKEKLELGRLEKMLQFEKELYTRGIQLVAGIDEAGMAPLAGPVIAAAIILPEGYKLQGLNDSKKIPDPRKRAELAAELKRDAISWATGKADIEEIDRINIYQSGLLAMRRAMERLNPKPEYLLVDARTIPSCNIPQTSIVHGDEYSTSIAAASIIAKTTRDEIMIELDRIYPDYGMALHKGYPTPAHLELLRLRGPLPIHRKSFAPVRESMGSSQKLLFSSSV
jgi:ribonuclease HII